MAIAYSVIQGEVYLRSAQLAGTDQSSLQSAYGSLTLDGAELPAASFKNQILNIEAELSHIIAADISHPYRSYITGLSDPLANLDDTPTQDANGSYFIGLFDAVVDGTTGQPLTAMPTETLLDYQDPFFSDTELYNFAIMGNTIQHSRTAVKMVGCVFDRATRETAYDASGESPLPPILANTWIAGVLANLAQVGWMDAANTTTIYQNLYAQGVQMLKSGGGEVNLPLSSQNPVAG